MLTVRRIDLFAQHADDALHTPSSHARTVGCTLTHSHSAQHREFGHYDHGDTRAPNCCGHDVPPAGSSESAVATLTNDTSWGFDAIFAPVPSCLSEVILVIYVQSLPMLNRLDDYKNMYGPYFAGIEFYVDGTWCDPRGVPCYGDPLDR